MSQPFIDLVNITKSFDGSIVLDDLCLSVKENEFVTLLGPSGCGKTTLLRILGGFLEPTEGHVLFDGQDISKVPPYKREINTVFQKYALFPHMNVYNNIAFGLKIKKEPKDIIEQKVMRMLKLVNLEDYADRNVTEMSGGQQQRVAIARALVKNPRLLLLDEPLSNLDARLRLEMREEIRRIQQRTGVTTIFVTHDQEEALSISDRIVLMKSGVLQQNDLPQRLYNEPANQFVADFLGNPPINNIPGIIQDGRFVTEDGKGSASLELCKGVETGRKVNLSVRSESFVLDANGPIACEVTRVYQMGKEEMAYLRMGECDFRAYIDSEEGLKAGDRVHLALKKRGVFLFDRETGERIR